MPDHALNALVALATMTLFVVAVLQVTLLAAACFVYRHIRRLRAEVLTAGAALWSDSEAP